jgi:hypothetical protein
MADRQPRNIYLGPHYGGIQGIALSQIGGNGAGQGTAGAEGIRVGDTYAVEPIAATVAPEQIDGLDHLEAAQAEHGTAVYFADSTMQRPHTGG